MELANGPFVREFKIVREIKVINKSTILGNNECEIVVKTYAMYY